MMTYETAMENGKCVLRFAGNLSEGTDLPAFAQKGQNLFICDFKKIQTVNSSGVQSWIKWVQSLPAEARYEFENLPVQFVYHLSSVKGMLPPRSELSSFFVPYFNAATEEIELVLFRKDQQFTAKSFSLPARMSASENSKQILELDADAKRYFSFLKIFYPLIQLDGF